MIKIGLLGAGHLGKIHLKCLKMLPEIFEVIGVYDTDESQARSVAEDNGVRCFASMDELVRYSDAVDIVTPTIAHHSCAMNAISQGKNFFIEKPLTQTLDEALELKKESELKGIIAQVGHVERYNPAFRAALPYLNDPQFIEAHRLSQFNPRGTDVSVILDLMIHDLDIILSVVKSPIKHVSAGGASVLSETPDIANARLEFENGCVANLTASRISLKSMRKARFFQKDAYVSVDFLTKESEVVRMREVQGEPDPFAVIIDPGSGKPKKELLFDKPVVVESNAIRDELAAFGHSVLSRTIPEVSLSDGYRALEAAHRILAIMKTPAQSHPGGGIDNI